MFRKESDLIGTMDVPADAYYGVQTLRAMENFKITGLHTNRYPVFINAFAKIKKVAAMSNHELGLLDKAKADAIIKACDVLLSGKHHDQFLIDPIQGGAGTSMNMNANEVIANIGLELMGHKKGEYEHLSPNDHVNMAQSTNDTYPSSIKVAVYDAFFPLFTAMEHVVKSFKKKGDEYAHVIKMGRTQLQDAVPMTAKQGFYAMASMLEDSLKRLKDNQKYLTGLNMGATAIGTGCNTHPEYTKAYTKLCKGIMGADFHVMENLFVGTQDTSGFAQVSGSLKAFAAQLSKISSDLRLLASGPRAGLGDYTLPAAQPGSSIMPGKINPVIPEAVNQACFQVIGYDMAIALCVEGGQLELNAFEPLIVSNLLSGMSMLTNALDMLRTKCIDGIVVNVDTCKKQVENSPMIATFLNPVIGYKNATKVAQRALAEGKTVKEIVLEMGLMDEAHIDKMLSIDNLTKPQVH